MQNTLNILVADRQKAFSEGLKIMLTKKLKGHSFTFLEHNPIHLLSGTYNIRLLKKTDVLLLEIPERLLVNDIILIEKKIQKIQKTSPDLYLILQVQTDNLLLLYDLYKRSIFNSIIAKADINEKNLMLLFKAYQRNEVYFSKKVIEARLSVNKYSCFIDSRNREIVNLLGRAVPNHIIAEQVNLTKSGLIKRKRKIKEAIGISTKLFDYEILKRCQQIGLLKL